MKISIFTAKAVCLLGVLLFALLVTSGCGGGGSTNGGGNGAGGTPPAISNAVVSPTSAQLNQGGGAINVNLTMNFVDPDGDVVSFTLDVFDQSNTRISTHTYPISGVSGVTSGVINGIFVVETTTVGSWTTHIYVTDADGALSNTLVGTFSISSNPSTALITSYLSTAYQANSTSLNNDIASIEAQTAANGSYGSGNMIYNIEQAKVFHVNSFLTGAVNYISTTHNSYTIDKPAIVSLLNSYKTQDLAYPTNLVISGISQSNWLPMWNAIAPAYSTSLDTAYNNATAQVNAL
ncbi:MAG: hypothetical protein ACYC3W_11085 [Candidatus Nanopelagicales bacterium]